MFKVNKKIVHGYYPDTFFVNFEHLFFLKGWQMFDYGTYGIYGTKYSEMDQVKFVEDSLEVIWSALHKFFLVNSWVLCPIYTLPSYHLQSL